MNLLDLLTIPGLDSTDRLRELRKQSQDRLDKAIARQRVAYALMSLASKSKTTDKKS